ncbi:CDP-glycerol glycerophosphotransferase family protein [Candidatus Aciduliprofundum boonei]|uniref:CDP-glycerol:poly(Glycerophosphate) glycerophosphotransferase n=1 Tax=Aciduliprofundum boonei (strain DSM 19572 / T469) TaxID=439481 RepID=D3TD83_ACIB4|nr:CDP-glycerol glycerophosphotransferase family protein [Candidatus Aciduliprofundum boonei]ADD08518.1 CDP-glycerol:poly(glycerophosphate) glycerophosphotransferase [Aciduliprofundum boonei T469]
MKDSKIAKRLIKSLNNIIPKKDIILFYSQYDYYDNPYYLYQKMRETKICEDFQCVWIVDTPDGFERVVRDGGIAIFRKNTKDMLKYITKARYFVTSVTGGAWWKSKNQIEILLDHGIPLQKKMGAYVDATIMPETWKYFDYAVTTSHFTRVLHSSFYQINPFKIIITGMPRDDIIFEIGEKYSLKLLEDALKVSIDTFEYKLFYLPTFRSFNNLYTKNQIMKIIKNDDFIKFLKINDILFVFKPHRKDEVYFRDLLKKRGIENIKILSNDVLRKNNFTINEFFKAIDILISDYSSVWIEYLLLNRPIIYYIPDIEEYRKKRGFVVEPFELWTPGDKVKDIPPLINALEGAINDPKKWEKERLWLRDVMFTYKDNKARERIIKYFWG